MRVSLKGTDKDGKAAEVIYDLHDEYDPETGISSMSRTTGYTATAAANWLLDGHFDQHGVFPPELIGGHPGCFDYFLNHLAQRGVHYTKR